MIRTTIAAATLALLAGTAFAQANTPGVDARQERQEQRIEQGKASGSNTASSTSPTPKRVPRPTAP
jgi:hypothetical protein